MSFLYLFFLLFKNSGHLNETLYVKGLRGGIFLTEKVAATNRCSFSEYTTDQFSSSELFQSFSVMSATRPNWKHDSSKFPGYSSSQKRAASAGINSYILFSTRTVLGIRFDWAEHVERFETFVCFASLTSGLKVEWTTRTTSGRYNGCSFEAVLLENTYCPGRLKTRRKKKTWYINGSEPKRQLQPLQQVCVAQKQTMFLWPLAWLSSTETWLSCFSRPWQVLAFQIKRHRVVILLVNVLLRRTLNYKMWTVLCFMCLRFDFSAPDLRVVGSYTRFLTMVLLSVRVKVLWRLFHAGPSHISKKMVTSTSGKGARSIWTPAADDFSACSPELCMFRTEPHPFEQDT